jgi:hypothetical protein
MHARNAGPTPEAEKKRKTNNNSNIKCREHKAHAPFHPHSLNFLLFNINVLCLVDGTRKTRKERKKKR